MRFIQENLDLSDAKFLGASAGSLPAGALAGNVRWETVREMAFDIGGRSARSPIGPLFRCSTWQRQIIGDFLATTPNLHRDVSGRLHISVTTFPALRNVSISHFESNDHLLTCLLGSMLIPVYSGKPVVHRNSLFIDGGITQNSPVLSHRTIVISPNSSAADIFPRKPYNIVGGLIPDSKTVMERKMQEGYERAYQYFDQNRINAI